MYFNKAVFYTMCLLGYFIVNFQNQCETVYPQVQLKHLKRFVKKKKFCYIENFLNHVYLCILCTRLDLTCIYRYVVYVVYIMFLCIYYNMYDVKFSGKFSFWSQPDSHGKSTIKEFIEQCVKNSRNGQFLYFIRPSGPGSPPMPVHLLYPISRYRQMRSLQHMCRFCILQFLRRDHIDALGIPTRIKDYLKDPQYYVEYLDD